jgi:hypothetical protein
MIVTVLPIISMTVDGADNYGINCQTGSQVRMLILATYAALIVPSAWQQQQY